MPGTPREHLDYTVEEWRRPEFQAILEPLKDIRVAYDIGANAGGFSAVLLERFPDCDIHAFEPVSETYDFLKELPLTAHKMAIFYGPRESRIFWRGGNIGAMFIEEVEAGPDRIDTWEKCQVRTLEELGLPKPDLVKLDIEGAETNVLEHSDLIRDAKWVIVEWHPSDDPYEFFNKYLPDHGITVDLEGNQFLLCRK